MTNKTSKEYHASKFKPIVQIVARLVQKYPDMAENMDYLWTNVMQAIPELKDKTKCANCGESMAVYKYSVTYLDAKLLCAMAEVITRRMDAGMSFTEANKVHLQKEIKDFTLGARGNISSKLGLIAKVMKKNKAGKLLHDRRLGWSITRRGFDFLKGKPIPKTVKVFHNAIQEHFEETITMTEVYAGKVKSEVDDMRHTAGVFIDSYERPKLL